MGKHVAGEKAYYDSFAGMIPCQIRKVIKPGSGSTVTLGIIEVELLKDMDSFSTGEIIISPAGSIVPKSCWHPQRGRVSTIYEWIEEETI